MNRAASMQSSHVLAAVMALVAAGCLQVSSIQCDDGRTCPAATTCDLTHHLCVLPSQLDACRGKVENDADRKSVV